MYAKLFTQMYDGTLATKGPWQALVTFQQLIILADPQGELDMTVEAISRRTTIPVEILREGIVHLLEPDDQSRTPTEDGRRIVRLSEGRDWGWRIVNYEHYRAIRSADERREYHRQYYRDKRSPQHDSTDSTGSTTSTGSTEAVSSKQYALTPCAPRTDAFLQFWNAYPKKRSKGDAEKVWKALKPDASMVSVIVKALESAKGSKEWRKDGGQFIPYPATWLRRKGWEDVLTIAPEVAATRVDDCGKCGKPLSGGFTNWHGKKLCSPCWSAR